MHYLKMSKKKEWAPSSSKPYQVHELLPVWGGITEDDRLVHFLSHCHGNNSCNQSAPSGRRSLPGMLLRVNVCCRTDGEEKTVPETMCFSTDRGGNARRILCCQCIVDRRKPLLARVDPPTSSVPPHWAHPCSRSSSRPTNLCFCECYSVKPLLVERFFCLMLVMHMCKKPHPLTLIPAEVL